MVASITLLSNMADDASKGEDKTKEEKETKEEVEEKDDEDDESDDEDVEEDEGEDEGDENESEKAGEKITVDETDKVPIDKVIWMMESEQGWSLSPPPPLFLSLGSTHAHTHTHIHTPRLKGKSLLRSSPSSWRRNAEQANPSSRCAWARRPWTSNWPAASKRW